MVSNVSYSMNLDDSVTILPLVGPSYANKLEKLGVRKIKDLLLHIPSRYVDLRNKVDIAHAQIDELSVIEGKVISFQSLYTKKGLALQLAKVEDNTGQIDMLWFNQPYLARSINQDETYSFSGKISWYKGKKAMMSPDWERYDSVSPGIHTGRIVPTYAETRGISSKWLRRKIWDTLQQIKIPEFLPNNILQEFGLIDYDLAVRDIHFPTDMEKVKKARERLAFNELLSFQTQNIERKNVWQKDNAAHKIRANTETISKFLNSLPFELTSSQMEAYKEILNDMQKEVPMNRLLEGDVGSGKTIVAAIASIAVFKCGLQSIFMAPTQILAQQHFNTLKRFLSPFDIKLSLITSDSKLAGKNTDIFIGTHALINGKIDFGSVGLVVVDEQHRFGVKQRTSLIKRSKSRSKVPHVLNMTATPIPRTIAHTIYGDLDLSTLDELPEKRKRVTTWIIPPTKRDGAYKWIADNITKEKIQVFVVCPLINEMDKKQPTNEDQTLFDESIQTIKAATQEYQRLQNLFKDKQLGLLHGKMKSSEKQLVLDRFRNGKIDILVATPVVEVGIDVPNATIMIIEGSERFGLSQLHQLRGRVGRGEKKSYCLLFTDSKSEKVQSRLNALQKTYSGFELAELDLTMRGPGEVFGIRQHGVPELKIASWQDTKLIKNSQLAALKLSGQAIVPTGDLV